MSFLHWVMFHNPVSTDSLLLIIAIYCRRCGVTSEMNLPTSRDFLHILHVRTDVYKSPLLLRRVTCQRNIHPGDMTDRLTRADLLNVQLNSSTSACTGNDPSPTWPCLKRAAAAAAQDCEIPPAAEKFNMTSLSHSRGFSRRGRVKQISAPIGCAVLCPGSLATCFSRLLESKEKIIEELEKKKKFPRDDERRHDQFSQLWSDENLRGSDFFFPPGGVSTVSHHDTDETWRTAQMYSTWN